jgi:hypothetical protein
MNGHLSTATTLLDDAGGAATLNWADDNSATALHYAAHQGHKEMVALLLSRGADTSCKDKDGHTAMKLAARAGHTDVVRLIVSAVRAAAVAQPTPVSQVSQPVPPPTTQQQGHVSSSPTQLPQEQQLQQQPVGPAPHEEEEEEAGASTRAPMHAACDNSSGAESSGGGDAALPEPLPRRICDQCGCEGEGLALLLCGGCLTRRYCAEGPCQSTAWRGGHRKECPELQKLRQAAKLVRRHV